MIITDKGTIIRTSDNTRNLEYWQSEETDGVVQIEPAYPAITTPLGAIFNNSFSSSGGKKSVTLLTNTPLKCTSDYSWLSVKFSESNSDTVSLETLLSKSNITRGKLLLTSSNIWTCFGVTLEAEAGAYTVTNGKRSATVRFYTADGGTGLLTPPNGQTFFTLGFTQSGPEITGETGNGTLQLTVNAGAEYTQINVNFELRTGGSGPQFIYDSKTNPNPVTYDVTPGTYTPYFMSATGYRGTSQGVNLSGRFDKTSVAIQKDSVTNLTLTLS